MDKKLINILGLPLILSANSFDYSKPQRKYKPKREKQYSRPRCLTDLERAKKKAHKKKIKQKRNRNRRRNRR